MRSCIPIARRLFSLAILLPLCSSVFAAPPNIQLSTEALTISGLAPGASVALLSVAREQMPYMARVVSRRELLVDDDRDGRVRYAPEVGIAYSSIWIAIDVATGDATFAMPDGVTPLVMEQRGAGEGHAVEAIINSVEVGRTSIDVVIVRPGVGAWSANAQDGSDADKDGRVDGRLRLDQTKLQPLRTSYGDAPNSLRKGDVVALLDAQRMEYRLETVKGGQ
jgi:hypothetical protein